MIRSGRPRQWRWAVQATAATTCHSPHRATLSRARMRAGSRRPSGGSEAPCVAPVIARYGIRRTPSTAGSRPPRVHKEGGESAGLCARRARCLPRSFDDRGHALRLVSGDAIKICGKYSSTPSHEVSSGTPCHHCVGSDGPMGVIGQKAPAMLDAGSDPLGQATAERPPVAASGARHGPSVCVWSEGRGAWGLRRGWPLPFPPALGRDPRRGATSPAQGARALPGVLAPSARGETR
jgi:hypothetical protein